MKVFPALLLIWVASTALFAQETLHRIVDPRFEMVYEITSPPPGDEGWVASALYVYHQEEQRPSRPLFRSSVQIWSAFQSDDGRYLVVHHEHGLAF